MHRFLILVLVTWVTSGCSKVVDPFASYTCPYEQDLPSVTFAMESGSIFLFGERHGTLEAPSFVAGFACKIAKDSQKPTIVLLELAIPEILSDLSAETMSVSQAQRLIVEGDDHWIKEGHDGRTSDAMMGAILQILELREQGLNIALGSIYPDENIRSKYDELGLTFADEATHVNRYFQEALQILRHKDEFENVIVLSGKNHTRNHLRFFKKMGLDETYMGFVQESGGGSEWNCQPMAGGCGVHAAPTHRRDIVNSSDNASLVMLNKNEELFDGAFVFKTTTASHPYHIESID